MVALLAINPRVCRAERVSASTPPGCCSPRSPSTTRCPRCCWTSASSPARSATRPRCCWAAAAAIFVTNIIVFGIWYWELDRGGPFARHVRRATHTRTSCSRRWIRHRQAGQAGLAADVRRLPVRQPDQRDGVLPHRHHAAGALGEGHDGDAGLVAVYHRRARNRKGGERFGLNVQPEKRSTFAFMGIATTELSPIEQTAFLTEYARALDSRWPRPILGDTLADDVVGKIDYDFAASVCRPASCARRRCAPRCSTTGCARSSPTSRCRRRRPRRRSRQRLLPRRTTAVGRLVQRRPARDHRASRRGASRRHRIAFGAGLAGRRALAGRHPCRPPDDACRRRAVRIPHRAA